MRFTSIYILLGLASAALASPISGNVSPGGPKVPAAKAPGPERKCILLGKVDGPTNADTNVKSDKHHLPAEALNTFPPAVNFSLDASVATYDPQAVTEPNNKANTLMRAAAKKLGLPADVQVLFTGNLQIVASADRVKFTITGKMDKETPLKIDTQMPLTGLAMGKGNEKGSWIKDKSGQTLYKA
ncbi:hypothetical protein GYMLUDRAFT_97286 [Collybiopsis luxurians FD-317 M1]|uniref:Uncharacterized protein n=1 Tax=Collybiopsis luxurians FD-317 M1 TaxID=944289 RepID=A0A0D0B9B5_9AGAR|nr:hypothetical protein GYMLUDRAFT_97286 [Collybiopsis luxurians FD-317 M1]